MANNAQLQLPKTLMPIILIGIIAIIFLSKSTVTLDAGEAGVLWKRFDGGVVTDEPPLGEGFHFVAPWNNVIVYEVRQQELYETMKVLSSNGLDILLETSTWYLPKSDELGQLHQKIGENYLERIIKPALRSAARSVVGRYTPEQLYSSKRDIIELEILEQVRIELEGQYVNVKRVLVENVKLPNTIKDAIERKLKQEQESLEYEFRLVTAKKEAEKVIIEAQGKADANKILSASLTDKILQDKGIEATVKLSESSNSKVIVIGSGDSGMPIILGNQ